jgi:lysophospholipase L1-like esterase
MIYRGTGIFAAGKYQSEKGNSMKPKIILLGDSLTEFWNWRDLKAGAEIINHGLAGDTTMGLWGRVSAAAAQRPETIVLQVGVNDLGQGLKPEEILANHLRIWRDISGKAPQSRLIICTLMPIRQERLGWAGFGLTNERIRMTNALIKDKAREMGLTLVDLYALAADEYGELPGNMTYDGVHLTAPAYQIWSMALKTVL